MPFLIGVLNYLETPYKFCSKCRVTRYCSPECQKKHWPTHRTLCSGGISHLADRVMETLMFEPGRDVKLRLLQLIRQGTRPSRITLSTKLANKIITGQRVSEKAFTKGATIEDEDIENPKVIHHEIPELITKIQIEVEGSSGWLILCWIPTSEKWSRKSK